MEHCAKHDILYGTGGTCWCCEDSAMTREQKDKAYRDPKHLAKRTSNVSSHAAPFNPEMLTDEQLDAIEAAFKARDARRAAAATTPDTLAPAV